MPSSSSRHSHRSTLPHIRTVVTIPPWAKDEPPSPKDQVSFSDNTHNHTTESRPSDVASYHSGPSDSTSRWWAFTLPRTINNPPSPTKSERKGIRERSMSWFPTIEGSTFRKDKDKEQPDGPDQSQGMRSRGWDQTITLPSPTAAPFTLAQNVTPGWESPWTARVAPRGAAGSHIRESSYGLEEQSPTQESQHVDLSIWQRRKKKLRTFILTNTYIPLLFRFINITFTTAALGMAIRIRETETKNNAVGAVGSSPTVVIIFAPLTLVYVMIAIYLEYFGRPLGLWRTSAKLAHTLSEVVLICAWSAALSLCFDNFFTSLVPCAPASQTSWYNNLPRPPSIVPNFEGAVGDRVCDDQLALICLVGVGLLVYCTNLVISLFRIFEKVKYHPGSSFRQP
ncbi:hypothetical protein BD779DRAFT_24535 [Infundibulicybe gibba]|nr:hypothetical protein BD779DRAFT_24535 [Infundibulicybe gibba]